jgi:hypothetical protein
MSTSYPKRTDAHRISWSNCSPSRLPPWVSASGLKEALRVVRRDDTLVVTKPNRLARSTSNLPRIDRSASHLDA